MRTSSEVVTTYDIFPTVAAILGVQPNVTIDGRDMTPVLLDAAAKTSHDCLYHWKGATGVYEGRQLDGLWAVRCGAYKVMRREGGGWGWPVQRWILLYGVMSGVVCVVRQTY
jgi:arylsulfatase A-like enzyme